MRRLRRAGKLCAQMEHPRSRWLSQKDWTMHPGYDANDRADARFETAQRTAAKNYGLLRNCEKSRPTERSSNSTLRFFGDIVCRSAYGATEFLRGRRTDAGTRIRQLWTSCAVRWSSAPAFSEAPMNCVNFPSCFSWCFPSTTWRHPGLPDRVTRESLPGSPQAGQALFLLGRRRAIPRVSPHRTAHR
jgi:hypothetical protein